MQIIIIIIIIIIQLYLYHILTLLTLFRLGFFGQSVTGGGGGVSSDAPSVSLEPIMLGS